MFLKDQGWQRWNSRELFGHWIPDDSQSIQLHEEETQAEDTEQAFAPQPEFSLENTRRGPGIDRTNWRRAEPTVLQRCHSRQSIDLHGPPRGPVVYDPKYGFICVGSLWALRCLLVCQWFVKAKGFDESSGTKTFSSCEGPEELGVLFSAEKHSTHTTNRMFESKRSRTETVVLLCCMSASIHCAAREAYLHPSSFERCLVSFYVIFEDLWQH